MKLATSLVLASAGLATAKKPAAAKKAVDLTASHKVSGHSARKLIRASRKLEENQAEEEEDEFYFLSQYRMKFVQCVAGEQVPGDDAYESSAVIYRLCPLTDVESTSAFGCTDEEAYGDYVVGINTFTQAIAQNIAWEREQAGYEDDGEFNLEDYAECREAEFNMEEDENDEGRKLEDEQQWNQYFIGPKCVNVMDSKGKKIVGTDIALEFFSDETCTTESATSYYELTGQEIPYSTGLGLYKEATKCASYNENGELEIKEVCQGLIEDVVYRCDAVYQGGCEKIEALEAELKASEAKMSGGKVFGIVLLVFIILGAGYYFWMKKKQKDAQNSLLNN